MHLLYPAVLAVLLFCTGLYGVLTRRNAILVLMSLELMLAAVSLNLVAFDVWLRDAMHSGQVLTLFLIALAAAEIGIGLAIVQQIARAHGGSLTVSSSAEAGTAFTLSLPRGKITA